MNVAIIFAGGTGQRMNTKDKPKQFLEMHGKPIVVYTIEKFQNNTSIDAIIVVMLSGWLERCRDLVEYYHLDKVAAIVEGGKNGQESIYNGLQKAAELFPGDSVVLIHDGVRPLVSEKTIDDVITCVHNHGTAITVTPAIETITIKDETDEIKEIIDRSKVQLARAPQGFVLKDLFDAHCKAKKAGKDDFIDSASLMRFYGYKLYSVEGSSENIKITTMSDFYIFRALLDAEENAQLM